MTEVHTNDYWERHPEAAISEAQWTSHAIVQSRVSDRMCGGHSGKHWLNWLLDDFFSTKNFESLLSPGCGVGDHEIIVGRSGKFKQVDAFDFSNESIRIATNKATEANLPIHFYTDDLNKFTIPTGKSYDVIMCSGSLHHVRELERFMEVVKGALKPEGYFVINEYVGDCYNVYNQRQTALIDRIYRCFPPSLRSIATRDTFVNHSVQQSIQSDPSESVRSKLILPFLDNYFHIEKMHPFGGGLLHPLFPMLNNQALSNGSPQSEAIVHMLLEIESILMELPGGLDSDFCLAIMRQKNIHL